MNGIEAYLLLAAVVGNVTDDAPGIQALIGASTHVAVVEAVTANWRIAVEGARSTAVVRVVRPLKGNFPDGPELEVYHHLLRDRAGGIEPPKVVVGRHYVVFLREYPRPSEHSTVHFVLSDPWVSILPRHSELEAKVRSIVSAFNRPVEARRPQLFGRWNWSK